MDEANAAPISGTERLAWSPFDVLENISDALFTLDAEWRFTYVNARAELLLRQPRTELLGKNLWQEFPHPTDSIFYREYHRAMQGQETTAFEAYSPTLDTWLFVRASCLQTGLCVLLQDSTERKRAEEASLAREARLNGILTSAMDAIISVDVDQRVLFFNAAAEAMFLCPAADAIGTSLNRFIPPRFHAQHVLHVRNFGETGVTNRTMGVLTPLLGLRTNGEEFPIEATISQIGVQGQKLYTAIIRDVTERKLLEEQFLQAQKMEGLGRLAGGIAHDFNNLLVVIMGYAELAGVEASDSELFREYLANVTEAVERATALTSQLLAFARKQVNEPKIIDLNVLLNDLEKLLRRLIGEHIALSVVEGEKCIVRVDPNQLGQVLINLAVNARDAMPGGGQLTLQISPLTVQAGAPLPHLNLVPGHYATLSVRDSGVGMTEQVKAHLFEPFFTTKGPGKGTGLGLATSYGIIKQSGGDISVESEPGQGSTFTIYLPLTSEPAAPLRPLRTLARMPVGTETILLVEDEPLVRGLAAQILRSLSYTVVAASDGQEALDIVHGLGEEAKIDILVTDVIMPRMGGHELAQRLRMERVTLKVLYCSGYTDHEILDKGVLEAGTAFLPKPYTPSALALKVREMLDEVAG